VQWSEGSFFCFVFVFVFGFVLWVSAKNNFGQRLFVVSLVVSKERREEEEVFVVRQPQTHTCAFCCIFVGW
jgi:hypothetical protein